MSSVPVDYISQMPYLFSYVHVMQPG